MNRADTHSAFGPRTLAARLVLALGAVMLIGNTLLLYQLYAQARLELIRNEQSQLRTIAGLLAQGIDGDAHEAAAREYPGRDDVRRWAEASEELRTLQRGLARASEALALSAEVHTLRLRESRAAQVAAAPDQPHPEAMERVLSSADTPQWRHPVDFQPAMWDALSRGRARLVQGEGRLSIYQPLLGADGKSTGLLSLERSIEEGLTALRARYLQMLMIAAGTLLGVFAAATAVAQRTSRSLYALEQAARRLVDGDLSEPVEVGGSREVELLSQSLESLRTQLAEHRAEVETERAELLSQLSEVREQLDPLTEQRRERLAALADELHITLRIGDREIAGAAPVDLSYEELVVRFAAGEAPELPVGTPLAARILLKGQPAVDIRYALRRARERSGQVELSLVLHSPQSRLRELPDQLTAIINARGAPRVRPAGDRPVQVALSAPGGGELTGPVSADDLSIRGLGCSIGAPPEQVGAWGSQVTLRLTLPGSPPFSLPARIRNVEATRSGGSRLGIAFDAESPDFSAHRAAIQDYVDSSQGSAVRPRPTAGSPPPATEAGPGADQAAALARLDALDALDGDQSAAPAAPDPIDAASPPPSRGGELAPTGGAEPALDPAIAAQALDPETAAALARLSALDGLDDLDLSEPAPAEPPAAERELAEPPPAARELAEPAPAERELAEGAAPAPTPTGAPIDEAPTEQPPIDEAPIDEAPTAQLPIEEAPTEQAPAAEAPTEQAPTEQAPAAEAPTEQAPTEQAPTEQAPAAEAPTEQAPTEQAPTEQVSRTGAPIDGSSAATGQAAEPPAAPAEPVITPEIAAQNLDPETAAALARLSAFDPIEGFDDGSEAA